MVMAAPEFQSLAARDGIISHYYYYYYFYYYY